MLTKRQTANKKRREAKYGKDEPRKTQKFLDGFWLKPWEYELLAPKA